MFVLNKRWKDGQDRVNSIKGEVMEKALFRKGI